MKVKIENEHLEDYCNDELDFETLLNKFLYDGRSIFDSGDIVEKTDWYDLLSQHVSESLKGTPFFEHQRNLYDNEERMSTLSILFFGSMKEKDMIRLFEGEPVYHDYFGEGFMGEYNEETEDYGEPERKESYASYVVRINGDLYHIGYDHRGNRIEVDPKVDNKKILEDLKELADEYIKILKDDYSRSNA
jgi:hypothetical protein